MAWGGGATMAKTRHKGTAMIRWYIRAGSLFRQNAAAQAAYEPGTGPAGVLRECPRRATPLSRQGLPAFMGGLVGYLRCPGAIHPHFFEVTPTKLEAWPRRGWRVVAWGADSEAEVSAALGWGLDGIITDRPVEAVGCSREAGAARRSGVYRFICPPRVVRTGPP